MVVVIPGMFTVCSSRMVVWSASVSKMNSCKSLVVLPVEAEIEARRSNDIAVNVFIAAMVSRMFIVVIDKDAVCEAS